MLHFTGQWCSVDWKALIRVETRVALQDASTTTAEARTTFPPSLQPASFLPSLRRQTMTRADGFSTDGVARAECTSSRFATAAEAANRKHPVQRPGIVEKREQYRLAVVHQPKRPREGQSAVLRPSAGRLSRLPLPDEAAQRGSAKMGNRPEDQTSSEGKENYGIPDFASAVGARQGCSVRGLKLSGQ